MEKEIKIAVIEDDENLRFLVVHRLKAEGYQVVETSDGEQAVPLILEEKPGRVVLVDDVLATGGTLKAAARLCEANRLHVQAMSLLINLTFLNKFKEEGLPVISVLNY